MRNSLRTMTRRAGPRAGVVLATAVALAAFVGAGTALANAANPNPDITGTATQNSDGTVTVSVNGTWSWPGQNCEGRYGEGWAVDWWGISTSPTPNPSFSLTNATEVNPPGTTTTGTISPAGSIPIHPKAAPGQPPPPNTFFHVPAFYAGEDVNSASTCTDTAAKPTGSTGAWSASATYPAANVVPPQICVIMYDEHGSEGKISGNATDFNPVKDSDNSIQTNAFNPADGMGFCTGITVTPPSNTISGHIYLCDNGVQTTTEVPGGTLGATGPQTVPTQPNPLGPVSVAAGTYTMTEANPSGYRLAGDCGTTSNTQTVVVPSGGAGVGIFYVEKPPTCTSGSGFRQASSNTGHGVTSISTTLAHAPTDGDLLIADVQIAEGGATTTSVTDGNLSFTLQKTVTAPSPDNSETTIWTLLVPCGATPGNTITATASDNADMGIAVMEYAGLSGAIDGSSSSSGFASGTNGTTTTVTSGVGAAANAGDLVLGFEADSGWSVNVGADTSDGYASRVKVQNNQVAEFLTEDQVATSSGTYNAKATITATSVTDGELSVFDLPGVPWVMGTIAFAHS